MSKIEMNPATFLGPVPAVLVSCTDGSRANIITIAWTGIINSKPPRTYISIRPERFSHAIISKSREFAINLTVRSMVESVDWCGVRSGRDHDKFAHTGLTPEPCTQISCPAIKESPLTLECRVFEIVKMGSHDMFLADIISVRADKSLIDDAGKLCLERAELLAYANGDYYRVAEKLGSTGFSLQKKAVE